MIVHVQREEIIRLLSRHYGKRVKDFVIAPDSRSVIGNACRAAVHDPLNSNLRVTNIKALRTVLLMLDMSITLAEGKFALEHWGKWIAFVDEYNRMPMPGYGSGSKYGVLI